MHFRSSFSCCFFCRNSVGGHYKPPGKWCQQIFPHHQLSFPTLLLSYRHVHSLIDLTSARSCNCCFPSIACLLSVTDEQQSLYWVAFPCNPFIICSIFCTISSFSSCDICFCPLGANFGTTIWAFLALSGSFSMAIA